MKIPSRKVWIIVAIALAVPSVCLVDIFARPDVYNESYMDHAHCIKQAGALFHNYAALHDGRFPVHPDGYGAALMQFPEDTAWYPFTGAGIDREVMANAKRTGVAPAEGSFGRVYVQGLNVNSNSQLVILFDQRPTPGGDHCHLPHRLWAASVREVLLVDGSTRRIPEAEWPAFARNQVQLLVEEGFVREGAERLYGLTSR